LSLCLLLLAVLLLGVAICYLVFAVGPHFHGFPDRTIGISLLSDVDPHYRTYLFLLASALCIALCWGFFMLTRWSPDIAWAPGLEPLTGLLAVCVVMNLLASAVHPHSELFLAGAALGFVLLALWLLHQRLKSDASDSSAQFVLEVSLGWQGLTLLYWLAGLKIDYSFLAVFLLIYPCARFLCQRSSVQSAALRLWILAAPLLLIVTIEAAYLSFGAHNTAGKTLLVFSLISLLPVLTSILWRKTLPHAGYLAGLFVLVTTAVLNEYSAEIVYRGYDVFHLAERVLPLQQAASFGLYPIIDFQPAHGLFDVVPHALYQWLSGGNPLESMIWGNGYFHGWFMRGIYIAIFYVCLAPMVGGVTAFFLLWLLPHFHLVEPYNTWLLLPLINLYWIATTHRLRTAWSIQWTLVLLLGLWRPDFALVLFAGNLVVLVVMSWYERSIRQCLAALAALSLVMLLAAVLFLGIFGVERLGSVFALMKPYMGIQILAASYDHFYRQWDYLATLQYVILPALGALAGGYSLARLYLREDRRQFALHLVIVFLTAIGFALAIRLFHRHTIAEGFSKPYFFIFAALLVLATLRLHARLLAPLLAVAVMLSFLAAPKMRNHPEDSLWGPQRSYPLGTRTLSLPQVVQTGPRLVDDIDRFDAFQAFSQHFLQKGETFYDFSNAPLLYALADVQVPSYVNETVYHTSETMQSIVLDDLGRWHRQKRLPFVVFRQNNPWDALDGADNALRSYRVAEFIYANYRPCIQIGKLELWSDKRRTCEQDIRRKVPQVVLADEKIRFLERNYLKQFIAYGHLPYIWANFDEISDAVDKRIALTVQEGSAAEITLGSADLQDCSRTACYLDLRVDSPVQQEVTLRFARQRQLSFIARPGSQGYRIRISAMWRWYRGGKFTSLQLTADEAIEVGEANLAALAAS
jgi:hypothetical protein